MANTDLVRLLNSVGKSTFISFFDAFADASLTNRDVVAMLPEEYTLKARNSRTSHARRVFREGLAEGALELICSSYRVDTKTATRRIASQKIYSKWNRCLKLEIYSK